MNIIQTKLSGWGRSSLSECQMWQPTDQREVIEAFSAHEANGIIGRGCGRSYGDVSSNKNGSVVEMIALNTIEHFDADTGTIVCGAGVTMSQLIKTYLGDGIVPPVCPGTGFVTVGGAVAFDVHGKNHDRHGSFGDHVVWLELLTPAGDVLRISDQQHPELFLATIGGAGLTGLIIRVAFRMLKLGSNAVVLKEQRIENLEHFMKELLDATHQFTYTVGWIDAVARGKKLGRGILLTADPADSFSAVPRRHSVTVPFNMPPGTFNRLSVGVFNFCYYHRIGRNRTRHVNFERFVFPLDALLHWNRLYGSRGVYQFQCVIPFDNAAETLRELMLLTTASVTASPLAVLKTLSSTGRGFLSFPMPGFTLALDFPRNERSLKLIKLMYKITLSNGGRIYLAKDACLDSEQFRQMYPSADKFSQVLNEIDPDTIMRSDMARRIGLRP